MTRSAIEAFTNAVIGLAVSWAVTFFALPLWGMEPSVADAGAITAMYFLLSFARSWVLREVFRRVWN